MSRASVTSAIFVLLAPGTTAGVVPWWITGWDRDDGGLLLDGSAVVLFLAGLVAVVACFVRFVSEGSGTPAPLEPTETLVIGGLYRHVRNPMYLAVGAMIAGQAAYFRSPGVALWLAVFALAVVTFVQTYEEPTLSAQFGESYAVYRRNVPGWWPRLRPWSGAHPS
jgi:protein-S-isoprenylcysteine O-methyltransferase Ste14